MALKSTVETRGVWIYGYASARMKELEEREEKKTKAKKKLALMCNHRAVAELGMGIARGGDWKARTERGQKRSTSMGTN